MKLHIRAGGSLRSGPERGMVDDYLHRANTLARRTGFHSVTETAVDLGKCRNRSDETDKIVSALPDNACIFVMDERGKSLTSRKFAKTLSGLRDDGIQSAIFLIGGADGFDPARLPSRARHLSFGVQTWPHKLVRVMLSEQIYRAMAILAGTPYHRD